MLQGEGQGSAIHSLSFGTRWKYPIKRPNSNPHLTSDPPPAESLRRVARTEELGFGEIVVRITAATFLSTL